MKPTRTISLPPKPNTVALSELSGAAMAAGNDQRYSRVIMRGVVIKWIQFAWINEGAPTVAQERSLPKVIE